MDDPYLSAAERLMLDSSRSQEIRAAIRRANPWLEGSQPAPVSLAVRPALMTSNYPPLLAKPLVRRRKRPNERLAGMGWPAVLAVCLLPTLLIVFDFQGMYHGLSLSTFLLSLGDITGVIGLVLYVGSLVLSTRWRFIETMFGGLNRVFMAHGIMGGVALIVILIHPLLTALSYYHMGLHFMANFFIPQLRYPARLFGIVGLMVMIGLLIVTLYAKLSYKIWLASHRYLGLAYALIAVHVVIAPNKITVNPVMHVYLLLLVILGAASYCYRTLLPNIFVRRYLYTIKSAVPKDVGTVEVTLSPLDKMIRFRPGQFIFISFAADGLSPEWHPFSISSTARSKDLSIDVKSLGKYTETLTRLLPHMVGMTVRVEGAYGRFSYQNFRNSNQIWIAGGIGITPFLSMVQTLGPGPYDIDLYYAVRNETELINVETLALHQSLQPGQTLRVFPFIADKYKSYLSGDVIAKNSTHIQERDFLLCGPSTMMQSIHTQLLALGVPKRHIHSEAFSLK